MGRAWGFTLGAVLVVAAVLATTASAGRVSKFTIHDERHFTLADFCEVEGLDVTIDRIVDIRVHIVPHGPEGLDYYLQHGTWAETLSANGKTLTSFARVTEKDMRVTDLGGGMVEVLILATGNATLYDASGKAIARNPGQTRLLIVFDANGNEVSREVARSSTGRSDDVCAAAVPALQG